MTSQTHIIQAAVIFYDDGDFEEAIKRFRQEHPGHKGNVIVIPEDLQGILEAAGLRPKRKARTALTECRSATSKALRWQGE